jgi:cysteinyl-tRNA synthetase
MRIYNTLSRKIEEFLPINDKQVGIYTCGPTVYDYPHIGNIRSFLLSDLLQRVLEFNDYRVKSVQNITDIDDKIIKRANENNSSIIEISNEYEKYFLEDIGKLNFKKKDQTPRATDYIEKMKDYIKVLIEKEMAYAEDDGSVYFDISKFENYGKLSGIKTSMLKTGTRVLSDEYDKDNVQDFALWKAEHRGDVGFDSPWPPKGSGDKTGWGRPGWHLECSVMSQENLGDTFDIHVGGVDLIFPHHENEIAQSEGKTGKKFVNYFIHGAHILVEGKKMSKSLGNFYRLKDIEDKGFDPLVLRYLYLQTHYRQEMNFTWEALTAAQTALSKLRKRYLDGKEGEVNIPGEFIDAINEDLNFPKALSVVWENIDDLNKSTLNRIDEVFGLDLDNYREDKIEAPQEIEDLVNKREDLRREGKYEDADKVRRVIESKGYVVEDSPDGPKIKSS